MSVYFEDLDANILSNVICLLKDEVESMYSKIIEKATELELKAAKKSLERKM